MTFRSGVSLLTLSAALAGAPSGGLIQPAASALEELPFAPRHYVCALTPARLSIDGKLDDPAWAAAAWTEPFIDIEGDRRPRPRFATRAKMLWDDEFFYVAAEMEEPDVWATLTERDAVIFHDNDFELFIDPDGDTHAYYELEVNALRTAWDLLLIKPYRDGGPAINAWDITGLQVGIDVQGTINKPGDRDHGWSVEIAMPWKILREAAPAQKAPKAGDQWRVNFSRVEWQTSSTDGRYVKQLKPGTKQPLPEDNWVWSPQGAVNMHMPERWGYVQFTDVAAGSQTPSYVDNPVERTKWALRRLYYRQRDAKAALGRYADTLEALRADDVRAGQPGFQPAMTATATAYEITSKAPDGSTVHISNDGRVWVTR